jgi:cytochrome oxidase Cu insertion factor (SCO1/SenC/PrrC family)
MMKFLASNRVIVLLLFFLLFLPQSAWAADDKQKSNLAEAIGKNTVYDVDGNPYLLATSWQEKPVVLVFIRHFG